MKKVQEAPLSLQNLENAFDDELEVEDEDDEQQRQQRIQSLRNQDTILKSYLSIKGNSIQQLNKEFILYQNQNRDSNPEEFDNYFRKYNCKQGMSAKFIVIDDDNLPQHSNVAKQGLNIPKYGNKLPAIESNNFKDDGEICYSRNVSLNNEERIVPNIMNIRLATMKKIEESKHPNDNSLDDEFDTPTPCDDDEENGIAQHIKSYSLSRKISNNGPLYLSKDQNIKKFNSEKLNMNKDEKIVQQQRKKNEQRQPYVSEFNTPGDNYDTPMDDFNVPENSKNDSKEKFMKAYEEQQSYLKDQALLIENKQNNNQVNMPLPKLNPRLSFQQNRENSIKEMQKSNSTEGFEEITPQQKQYFSSNTFKEILTRGILQDVIHNQEYYDNDHYIVILRDVKWNRIYLKKLNMYIQLRIFQSKEQYSVYIDSYNKIVTKFIKFMPQTIYSDDKSFLVIQKLGDFSLYDLSNLILIEAKQHETTNYQKYYLQMLSNLFDSLILILFHNYYIGNINSKNIFVSKVQNQFIIKFSNLVDFSFDYTQICDKNYACILQQKPTEIEIWFSELYACCRCMQEMMDRDRYYLQKKNIKEFINRHVGKYKKIMNILSFFLLKNDSLKNGVNFDVIQQFILSSFEENEKIISLSDRSIKHIQYMIQTSKMHLSVSSLDLNNKYIEQKLFFFIQQMNFHQDFDDEEIMFILKFVNRLFYKHLFNKQQESQLFYLMLNTLITDASIFRRNKNIQKSTYIIYVMYLLKEPDRIEKCIAYWRHMSQTTSLVDSQNPISLYYSGMLNLLLLDNQKALKYFQNSYQYRNYNEDIIQNSNKNKKDEDDSDIDYDKNNKVSNKQPKSPLISSKPKIKSSQYKTHSLFNSECEDDDYILNVREAYGFLSQLKYIFIQEGNVKKMYQLIAEARNIGISEILEKLITFELQIAQNIKSYLFSQKVQSVYFIDQIAQANTFNANTFLQTYKQISNNVTLTESFKQQFQQYQSTEQILFQSYPLFLQQVNNQLHVSEKVCEIKKLQFQNDKYKPKTFNSFHNLDSRVSDNY